MAEGKGEIKIGKFSLIKKNACFKIAQNSVLEIGQSSLIDSHTDIQIGKKGKLISGENFSLAQGSRIFINAHWQFGANVKIATNCSIFSRELNEAGKLIIGDGTYIGDSTILDITDNLTIGNAVAIGPNCTFYTHDHDYRKAIDKPAWKGTLKTNVIIIEDGAWIGSNVTILPGVKIGKNSVVAAGAVVTKSVDDYTTVGGIPAKKLN